jgi:2-oxoglutarate ferredoxin oxidoreductase subunit gamma
MNLLLDQQCKEIRFAGAGGQGLQAAATVLGKSFLKEPDIYVCLSQNYGPESRGGLSYSDLIISNQEIDFPKIKIPNILICMSNESFIKFKPDILSAKMTHLIVDPEMVAIHRMTYQLKGIDIFKISATLTSEAIFGSRIGANIVLIGALHAITGIGNPDAIEETLSVEWPLLSDENIQAFRQGIELGQMSRS